MALGHAEAPQGFLRQLGDRLTEVLGTRSGVEFLEWTSGSVPKISKPHPVYTLGRDDFLDGGAWLDDAALVAWRALFQLDGSTVYAIELDPKDLSLIGISKGPFGAATMETIGTALALDVGAKKLFGAVLGMATEDEQEIRLLRIPSLYFVGLWLHGGKEDSILPLDDHPSGLAKRKPHPPQAVHDALREWARGMPDLDSGVDEAN